MDLLHKIIINLQIKIENAEADVYVTFLMIDMNGYHIKEQEMLEHRQLQTVIK